MLNIYTGRSRLLSRALVKCVGASNEETELIVVPKQLTLATEQLLLDGLNLKGSFRIQVLSSDRLCARIFDAAGQPDGARIDDRGRVMLVRAAIRAAEENLTIYRGAEARRGFPERAANQLERIRQAGVNAETLRECAEEMRGASRLKLNDLSYIQEAYESLIAGRYQDGEEEILSAIARVEDAAFLEKCGVWVYGFDMMPPPLQALIASVGARSAKTGLFLPLENDSGARDFDAFQPLEHAMAEIMAQARQYGCAVKRIEVCEEGEAEAALIANGDQISVTAPKRKAALRHLEHELFAFPAKCAKAETHSIQLTLLRNPQEECRFAAALVRRLVIQRNWRWRDVAILARDLAGYAPMLKSAFEEYGIPIFLSENRPAARHVAAEYLLTALKAIEKGYPPEDMFALMGTGMSPLEDSECERLMNYAVRYGLRGTRFARTLTRGLEAEVAEMEPLREKLMAPLIQLKEKLRAAKNLDAQMIALFEFLEDSGAYQKSEARIQALSEAGMRETAGEEAQVWNRIMGAIDQMHALMGENRLSIREIRDTLNESLSAAVIKPLPQSADAVHAQSVEKPCAQEVKALILVGMTDRAATGDDGLLTPAQKRALSDFAHVYLGPDDSDLTRMRRFYLKSSFGMATDYVSASCPLSGTDGSSQRPSAVIDMIRALFPNMRVRGGVTGEMEIERMLRSAPKAAVALSAIALSGEGEGKPLTETDKAALAGLKTLANKETKNSAKTENSSREGEQSANSVLPCAVGDQTAHGVSACAIGGQSTTSEAACAIDVQGANGAVRATGEQSAPSATCTIDVQGANGAVRATGEQSASSAACATGNQTMPSVLACAVGEQSANGVSACAIGGQTANSTACAMGEQSANGAAAACSMGVQSANSAAACSIGTQSAPSAATCAMGEQSANGTACTVDNQTAPSVSACAMGEQSAPSVSACSTGTQGAAESARAGLSRLSMALNRAQAADSLSPAAARELYGVIRTQSVTRLERFAACPFSYYVEYGLKPDRIEPFELRAKDEGSFFHEAIHEFLLRSMNDLNALEAPEAEARMDAVSESLLETMGADGPLGDSAVTLAEKRRLKATMRTAAKALAAHMHSSRFHATALEQSFGPEDGARAIRLDGDCVLEGRIDRIDEWDDQEKYLRVIDFKRGGKTFKLATVYYGLQLQLPAYLAAALARRGGKSAGVYYFPLEEGILATQSMDSAEIERDRQAIFRMEGIVPESEEVRGAMAEKLGDVFKVRMNKDGTQLYSSVKTATDADYRAITDCALKRAGEELKRIRSGVCGATPVKFEGIDPCRFCNYREVCLFDERLDAKRVRRLPSMGTEDALLKMKEENER